MPRKPATSKPTRAVTRRGPHLFLNPYDDLAFTRCPQCEKPTRVRKHYLVVHVEPGLMLVLNKSCRLCEGCELLIVKQAELESLMAYAVEQYDPALIGNDYLPLGTLDRADGRQVGRSHQGSVDPTLLDRINQFRDKVHYEPATWSWLPATESAPPSGSRSARTRGSRRNGGTNMARSRVGYEPPISTFRVRILGGFYAPEDAREVWREIEVAANQTLGDLGEAIPLAFEFDDPHLWSFFLSGKPWDQATEYSLNTMPDPFDGDQARAAGRIMIRDVPFPGASGKREFLFLFDYGDEWHFGVKLLRTSDQVEPKTDYPRIAVSHGEAPPQYPDVEEDWDEEEADDDEEEGRGSESARSSS